MRYRPNRQYLYPVLRPDADDYGLDSKLATICEPPQYDQTDGTLSISLTFDLKEPSLERAVHSNKARCAAMVYCGSTLYRDKLEATADAPFVATGRIPVRYLKNRVEVHPVILATCQFDHPTVTAHDEYQKQPMEVQRLAPLATDLHWAFDINSDTRPVRSIFRLETDENAQLRYGEFDIVFDTGKDYVSIKANGDTLTAFNEVRRTSNQPIPTVFTSAVVSVLAYVKEFTDDDGDDCEWLNCIRTQLRNHNLEIGGPGDIGRHSLLLAAQRLLQSPFSRILLDTTGYDGLGGQEDN